MKHKLTTLAAALDLRVFDLEQLAAKAGVSKATVQTVLTRQSRAHPDWVARSNRRQGGSGRPRATYEITAAGARAIAKELDQLARATTFATERAPNSVPPLGLLRAEQAILDLEHSATGGDPDGLVNHIMRNLAWARNELTSWQDSGASRWEYFDRLTSLQERALALTTRALKSKEERAAMPVEVELPREVFLGPFVDAGRSQELASQATMCLHAAGRILALKHATAPIVRHVRDFVEFRHCLASFSGAKLLSGARNGIALQSAPRIFMCVDSGADMHELRHGLHELASMHLAVHLVMLDVHRNNALAELAAKIQAAYRAEAMVDLSWVEDLRANRPQLKLAHTAVQVAGATQDVSSL